MNIINKNYAWCGSLSKRKKTSFIVLHHAAASSSSSDSIHKIHLQNGWAGIGYHFYIRKDGSIYSGRPIDTVGAHVSGYNSVCIGVCFEGNFEKEKMSVSQLNAGKDLIKYLKSLYPKAFIKKHKDLNATACPGKYFPFDKIVNSETTDSNEIVTELNKRGIMTNLELWQKKCKEDENSYHLARKICNMTINSKERQKSLESVNDIVWELHHRGIITDKTLWLKLFSEDKDLYYLGYKACNMTK